MIEMLQWTVVIIAALTAAGAYMQWRSLPATSSKRRQASGQVLMGVGLVLLMLSSLLHLSEPWEIGMILLAVALLVLAITHTRRGPNYG